MKNKEQAIEDFIQMIKESWTYQRLTKKEQDNFISHLYWERTSKIIKGSYLERYNLLNDLYWFYLLGIGYTDFTWREKVQTPKF